MPTPATDSVAWRRRDTTLTRETPRAVLILPKDAEEPLRLDGPAKAVWQELGAPRTDAELADRVAVRIGTTAAEVGSDVIVARTALALIGAVIEVR